jgi:ribosomal protein S12
MDVPAPEGIKKYLHMTAQKPNSGARKYIKLL